MARKQIIYNFIAFFCLHIHLNNGLKVQNVLMTEVFAIIVDPPMFNWTYEGRREQFTYEASLADSPDLPSWVHYVYSDRHRAGFLYGVPPGQNKAVVELDIVGLNKKSYETRNLNLHQNILSQELQKESATYNNPIGKSVQVLGILQKMQADASEFRVQVLKKLNMLNIKINDVQTSIENLKDNNIQQVDENVDEEFIGLFPLDIEKLNNLENRLLNEAEMKKMIKYLGRVGGSHVSEIVKRLMYKLLTNEVGNIFSWDGAKGKKKFKGLKLASVILNTVRANQQTKDATEADIIVHIKKWLVRSKDRINNLEKKRARVENVKIIVQEKLNTARNEVHMKIDNLNVADMFDVERMDALKDIFRGLLWKDSEDDLYVTFLESAVEMGARKPVNPKEGEGVVVRLGSEVMFSSELLELQDEVRPLYKIQSCPRDFKRTSVERYFRDAGFALDWCSFKLIQKDINNNSDMHKSNNAEFEELTDKWQPSFSRADIPVRSYKRELVMAISLPMIIMTTLVLALTFILCFEHDDIIVSDETIASAQLQSSSQRFLAKNHTDILGSLDRDHSMSPDVMLLSHNESPNSTIMRGVHCRPSPPPYVKPKYKPEI